MSRRHLVYDRKRDTGTILKAFCFADDGLHWEEEPPSSVLHCATFLVPLPVQLAREHGLIRTLNLRAETGPTIISMTHRCLTVSSACAVLTISGRCSCTLPTVSIRLQNPDTPPNRQLSSVPVSPGAPRTTVPAFPKPREHLSVVTVSSSHN